MTIDISKIKPGDEVTLKGRAVAVEGISGRALRVEVMENGSYVQVLLHPSAVVSHTPAPPKPLEVKDRVRFAGNPNSIRGSILHIHHMCDGVYWGFIRWDSNYCEAVDLARLERVP